MSDPAPPNVTAALAQWVEQLTLDAIPGRVQQRAKHLLLDGIAFGLVGAQLPWSWVTTAVLELEGDGDAVVIGSHSPFLSNPDQLAETFASVTPEGR